MIERGRTRARVGLRALGAGASTMALLCAAPALAQPVQPSSVTPDTPATNPPAPNKPAGAGSAGTSSGPSSVRAATAGTEPGTAGNTTGTSGTSAATETPPPPGTSNEVVVTGVRQSLASAQAIKKNSDTVVDAITAEDIGALPDRSVNEALQRVPGVAISRFAAPSDSQHFSVEGSGVVIRGLSYVRGEFNGRDTFAVSGGREIGFNDVPSELVGSIEVFKNLTADLVEGGIAGTVNINQRKPFDSNKDVYFLSASGNIGDLAGKAAPSVVGLISKRWEFADGSKFGVLLSGSYSQQYSKAESIFLGPELPRYNDDKNGNGVQDPGEGRTINAGTPYASTLFDTFPVPAGFNQVYTPVGAGSRVQDFDRERIGFAGGFQYENAAHNFLVTGQMLRTDSREDWLEHTTEPNVYYGDVTATFPAAGTSYTFDGDGLFTSGDISHTGGAVQGTHAAGTCADPTSTYCAFTNLAPNGLFTTFSNRHFYTSSITQDQSLNIKWDPTSRLHINLDGQYIWSESFNMDDIVDGATYSGVNVDLRGNGGLPQITLNPQGFNAASYFIDPGNIYLRDAFNNRNINSGYEWSSRADAQYDLSDDSFFRKVRVGFRWSERKQVVRSNNYNNWGAVSDVWTGGGPTFLSRLPASDYAGFSYGSDFFRGEGVQPPDTPFIASDILRDHDALEALLRQATAIGGGTYVPLEDRKTPGGLVDGYFLPSEVYRNSEETYGGYVRLDFGLDHFWRGMSLSGNVGVRYVTTEDISFGGLTFPNANQIFSADTQNPPRYTDIPSYCAYETLNPPTTGQFPVICTVSAAQQQAILAFSNGASTPDAAKQDYDHWLPAFNVKLQVDPKLLFRFAYSKAISRPNFGNLQDYTGVSVNGANTAGNFGFTATAQNPYLKPIEAQQFDVTGEWYFSKVGSLTASLFYKDLTNIILDNYGFTRPLTNNGQTFDVLVNGPANAPGHGKIKGAEIAYQQTYDWLPGVLKGLGLQANFTYIDPGHLPNGVPSNGAADGSRPPLDVTGIYNNLPLAGLSKYNANGAIFYDYGPVYARLAYSWRSKFLLTNRDCCFPYLPVESLDTGQMDGSVFYRLGSHWKLGLEAQNILDETTRTDLILNAQGLEAPVRWFKSDRQVTFTVSATY